MQPNVHAVLSEIRDFCDPVIVMTVVSSTVNKILRVQYWKFRNAFYFFIKSLLYSNKPDDKHAKSDDKQRRFKLNLAAIFTLLSRTN